MGKCRDSKEWEIRRVTLGSFWAKDILILLIESLSWFEENILGGLLIFIFIINIKLAKIHREKFPDNLDGK